MPISPKLICRFNVILYQNPSKSFFVETDKIIPNFIWTCKGTRILKTIFVVWCIGWGEGRERWKKPEGNRKALWRYRGPPSRERGIVKRGLGMKKTKFQILTISFHQ